MIYILNKHQEIVGVAVNGGPSSMPYFNDVHYETLEGICTYEFVVPADHEQSNSLEVNGHVIIKDMDGLLLLFQIKEIMDNYENNVPVRRVQCESAAINELLGDVQRPMSLLASTLENSALAVLNSSSSWILGEFEDEMIESVDFVVEEYMTVLEALNKICEEYSVEMYFDLEMNGTEVISKRVNFVKERGNETNMRFDYGHHLRNVSRTERSDGIITALVAVGKGDTAGNRLTLSTLAEFDDGNYYKIGNNDWIGSDEAFQQWGRNGQHIFGFKIFDDAEHVNALKKLAISELEYRSKPSLIYATTIIDVERMTGYDARKIRLGDRVIINDSTFTPDILISARVEELKRSYTDSFEFNDDIKLGNYITLQRTIPAGVARLQNLISRKEEQWNKIELVISSTGGTGFKNGQGSSTLKARTYQSGKEIDKDGTEFIYTWTKYDKDGNVDSTFSKTGKVITITHLDVYEKATFDVSIDESFN